MLFTVVLVSLLVTCHASPKARVKDSLSEQDHHKGPEHEHNPEFDHEAFLGKDEAKTFDELTPDQSKEKLGKLFHKVDADGDGQVTEDELKKWIQHTQNRYIREDSDKQMKQNDMDKDGHVSWDEYKKSTYGFLDENDTKNANYDAMVTGKKLFQTADISGDEKLNKKEYCRLSHPIYHKDMKLILIGNIMLQIDVDNDQQLTLDEYIKFISPSSLYTESTHPKWFEDERKTFKEKHDQNGDGRLDMSEVSEWIFPDDMKIYEEEAKHLIQQADSDSDAKISKQEMVDKFFVFVGSSVVFSSRSEL